MKHFRHEHPLIPNEKDDNDDDDEEEEEEGVACDGCLQPITITEDDEVVACGWCLQKISGSAHKCTKCYFYLHELCALIPVDMESPMHPEHTLTLLPPAICSHRYKCHFCDKYLEAFPYRCFDCKFNLDMGCAARTQSVKLETHVHPLSPMLSPASFECDACGGTEREDSSFICNFCSFWIHVDCASLPVTFKHFSHVHPLNLIFLTLPYLDEHWCGVCKERIDRNFWFYLCDGCSYFVHASCSRKEREIQTAIVAEGLDAANLICLPVPDESESVKLVDRFMKQMSLGDTQRGVELNHFSHDHPLSLSTEQKNDKICYACERPISAPFYSCGLCNFFLHKWCAELPKELPHPCHEHSLVLFAQRPILYDFFKCKGCLNMSNKFTFQCDECYYNLDVKCASLPSSVMHEVHEHPLLLKKDCITEGCAACDRRIEMFSYGCNTCNFSLHYKCALLPRSISHRYDKHPFILTYAAPIENRTDEYYCEFCLGKIDPKWWFYHCIICDQSACARCIYKEQM